MKYILVFLFFVPNFSFAKTIFEPSLGLTTGQFKGSFPGSSSLQASDISVDYTTMSIGARYGITRRYIHVTGILEGNLIKMGNDAGLDSNMDLQMNYGIGIGYEWNIPLRTYVTIGFPFSGVELSYYYSETFLIGLKYNRMKMEFAGVDLNVNTFGVAVNFPIEFSYPNHWWRKTDWE